MSNVARFLVGNVNGQIIAELNPDVGPISWRLSNVGQLGFSLAKTDSKAIEDYLHFGNRVLIQFDNGLPNWGGVIDPPRNWSNGLIECTAYSAEYLFSMRTSGKNKVYSGATVGNIFRDLIEEANGVSHTGIVLGSIFSGGDGYTVDYHYTNLLSIFRNYLTDALSDFDFEVAASDNNGTILFTANLYERKGSDKLNYLLVEGTNAEVTKLSEQGQLVNVWDFPGAGNDWGSDRQVGHAEDSTSIERYGYRQGSEVQSNIKSLLQLDALAATALAESKDPHNMIDILALNLAPAAFGDYDIGDSLRLIAPSIGFSGLDTTVRIIGRAFSPSSGTCELVVREEL